MLKYRYKAYEPAVREKVVDVAMVAMVATVVVSGIQAGFWASKNGHKDIKEKEDGSS